MTFRYARPAVLVGALLLLVFFCAAHLRAAENTVTGVVVKSGFSGVIVKASGDSRAVKYRTGKQTVFTPRDYRPIEGDIVTVHFSRKLRANGRETLVASALALLKTDPARQEISNPAVGIVRKVGRKRIRFEFPATGQVITMEMKRDTKKVPAHWQPAVGDKVMVYSDQVLSRFGRKRVMVIRRMEKLGAVARRGRRI